MSRSARVTLTFDQLPRLLPLLRRQLPVMVEVHAVEMLERDLLRLGE